MKKLLSLSMIVRDEEKRLPTCLKSVEGIVDEIVIVDTGSIDKTVAIAKSFGASVYTFPWIDDFAAARNESLKHCNGEWILYLDADESIDPNAKESFRTLLASQEDSVGGIVCTIVSKHRHSNSTGTETHKGGYPRIFKNLGYPMIQFSGRVHEQITPAIFRAGKTLVHSTIEITHSGYDQSNEVMQQKITRNYTLLLQHVREEPNNAYAWFQLGQTLAQMNLWKEAEDALRFSLSLGTLSSSVAASANAAMSQICGNSKRFEDALQFANTSLLHAPNQVYAKHLKAYSLLHLQRLNESEALFEEILSILQQKNSSVPMTGFDIELPIQAVFDGLTAVKQRKSTLSN